MRYTFKNTYLPASQLCLDPRNQRLFVNENDFLCNKDDDYSDPNLKLIEYILKSKKEHQLDKLILSIKLKDFSLFQIFMFIHIMIKNYCF